MKKTVTMQFLRETKTRRLFAEEGDDADLLGTLYVDKEQLEAEGAQDAKRIKVTVEVVA